VSCNSHIPFTNLTETSPISVIAAMSRRYSKNYHACCANNLKQSGAPQWRSAANHATTLDDDSNDDNDGDGTLPRSFPFPHTWEDDRIAWSTCSTAGFYQHEQMSQLGGLRWELAHVGARGTGCTPATGGAITITAIAQTLPATTFYVTGGVVT